MQPSARIDAPEALHHIIGRGIERRKIFRTDTGEDNCQPLCGGGLKAC